MFYKNGGRKYFEQVLSLSCLLLLDNWLSLLSFEIHFLGVIAQDLFYLPFIEIDLDLIFNDYLINNLNNLNYNEYLKKIIYKNLKNLKLSYKLINL